MLTPQFKITQTDSSLILVIRVPYVKVSSCQFHIQQNCFKFYLKPYLLSLTFQQSLKEVEEPEKATYYHQKHLLEVHLGKKNFGEFFQGLGLISGLMGKKGKEKVGKVRRNLVEVIGQESGGIVKTQHKEVNIYAYGFCHNYTDVFKGLQQQMYEIMSFNPDQVPIPDRFQLSQKLAETNLDHSAYLYDKYENEQLPNLLQSKQMQKTLQKLVEKMNSKQPQSYEQFKSSLKLTNKELLVDRDEEKGILGQLVSICYCFGYQLCCMDGEFSVQSAKTINNTCAVFNCCVNYTTQTIPQILHQTTTRLLSYSLYKHLSISQKVLSYLQTNLTQQLICAILTTLREMFNKSQPRYLLNVIYVDDLLLYCLKMGKKLGEVLGDVGKEVGEWGERLGEEGLGLGLQEQEQDEQQEDQGQQKEQKEEDGREQQQTTQQNPNQTQSIPNPKIIQILPQDPPTTATDTKI